MTPTTTDVGGSGLTRRTALCGLSGGLLLGGVVGGAGLLGGCSTDLPGSSAEPVRRSRAELTPDERSVADLLARLGASTDLLARTARRYPKLAGPLGATLSAERAHLDTLRRSAKGGRLPSVTATPAVLAATRPAALAAAQRDTRHLRAAYFSMAGRAESGSFARLLASMGCSLSQRLPGMTP